MSHWAVHPHVTMLVIPLLLAPFFPVHLCPPPLSPVCFRVCVCVCEFCLLSGTGSSGVVQQEEAVRWNSREFSPSRLTQHGSLHQPKPVWLLFLFLLLSVSLLASVWLLMMAIYFLHFNHTGQTEASYHTFYSIPISGYFSGLLFFFPLLLPRKEERL